MGSIIRLLSDDPREALAWDRRRFLKTAGVVTAAAATGMLGRASEASAEPESLVKTLYGTLNDQQRAAVCFDWNYQDPERGLLRTFTANNWMITKPQIADREFYTDDQRDLVKAIFEGLVNKDWHERYYQQMKDDCGGFGRQQSIAIFGKPGDEKCEFVLTGRHMTLRADGDAEPHVAFGGPIFYGHAASEFDEAPDHPGNVFWPQAVAANGVLAMLDGKQRDLAILPDSPIEQDAYFRGADGERPGLPVSEMSSDQKEHLQGVLKMLVSMYRTSDGDEAMKCLKAQGGLDSCALSFYRDSDVGDDGVYDNWRLEGPSFVWYFRGDPHVHVWVNVADDPSVELNA